MTMTQSWDFLWTRKSSSIQDNPPRTVDVVPSPSLFSTFTGCTTAALDTPYIDPAAMPAQCVPVTVNGVVELVTEHQKCQNVLSEDENVCISSLTYIWVLSMHNAIMFPVVLKHKFIEECVLFGFYVYLKCVSDRYKITGEGCEVDHNE